MRSDVEHKYGKQETKRREAQSKALIVALGVGSPAYYHPVIGGGLTGGVTLTAEEAQYLIDRLRERSTHDEHQG